MSNVRYRFAEFVLSPRRRVLVREGQEVALIPRYFDLLLLLVERRQDAVHRREIFERVWTDVNVSESALSQAVRTIRKALEDDPREPRFIRTVSRHGYRFVFVDVVEEPDDELTWRAAPAPAVGAEAASEAASETAADRIASWAGRGAIGAGVAGLAAGACGGLLLFAAPASTAPIALVPVLAVIGAACGVAGGAGVGAGLGAGVWSGRTPQVVALTAGAALGGGFIGGAIQWLARWSLAGLVGLDVSIGGALEGLAIGAASGLGFSLSRGDAQTETSASRRSRYITAIATAAACGVAGLALALAGRPLAGGTIHAIASAAEGAQATLAPLGRLIGEPDFGPVTGAILSIGEAATFGFGLAWGLTYSRRHRGHEDADRFKKEVLKM